VLKIELASTPGVQIFLEWVVERRVYICLCVLCDLYNCALEALRNALCKCSAYLLTYLLTVKLVVVAGTGESCHVL